MYELKKGGMAPTGNTVSSDYQCNLNLFVSLYRILLFVLRYLRGAIQRNRIKDFSHVPIQLAQIRQCLNEIRMHIICEILVEKYADGLSHFTNIPNIRKNKRWHT